jgi:ABC-type transport system involved in cytochrome c biogenesis permease subunit
VKVVAAVGAITGLALAILLVARFEAGRSNVLLATHVFTVTLGYTTTFLIGALGICFVGQRCLSDFSQTRLHSLTRVTFILGSLAAGLTAVGVILGMMWAKAEWGRYWAWDAKEVGGFAVIVWQAVFLWAHRLGRGGARGVIIMTLLGNIIVALAWFGAHMLRLGGYGTPYWLWLLAAVVFNGAFFLIGLAPAGWLRLRKAAP